MSDATQAGSERILSVMQERRRFAPPAAEDAGMPRWLIGSADEYKRTHQRSVEDPAGFWGDAAKELHWFRQWDEVLRWNAPDAEWFAGGKLNACYNCVDRQVEDGFGDDTAIIWEGEPIGEEGPEVRRLTYRDLQVQTSKFAYVLKKLGVKKGEVVTIYMGMVPELVIAMLACARIGAPHSVIFGGFSARSIADRVLDADSRIVITCDGAYRRGKVLPLKDNVDQACDMVAQRGGSVDSVVVLTRCGNEIEWQTHRDHSYKDLVLAAQADPVLPCEELDAEHMLFLLYTSGSTGKPKGIVHTTGGYSVYTYLTAKYTFNLIPRDKGGNDQVYWCTADCGWITGHSYIVYGILPNRVPTLLYEGAPDHPGPDRFWEMVERHKVTQFYTAPTAIRSFMKWGDDHPAKHDLSTLGVLGTVGEPINPEAWMWYHTHIGGGTPEAGRTPIVDTYWQTETGGHVITPMPGATTTIPGSCTFPFFGIDAAITDEHGVELAPKEGGLLVIRKPWPGMLRGVHGDRERFIRTYWSRVVTPTGEPYYYAGDAAVRDEEGCFWIIGRLDDVINVSGHRLGTMEIESSLVSHPAVVEAAVVAMPHEIKGQGIAAFCTLADQAEPSEALRGELREHVAGQIGAIARPDMIRFTGALPKTRSGKIMRRLLRDIAAGKQDTEQDTTTLEDFGVLAELREQDGV